MTTAENCGQWEVYPGDELTSLALPDYYSTYLSYTSDTSKYPNTGLRISGEFPSARYMSFNVYATRKGTSLGALTDYQIMTPAPGGNPFVAGSQARAGQYVINVQPAVSGAAGTQTLENLLNYPTDDLVQGLVTVVLRYYVPQADAFGGVACPAITAYDVRDPHGPPPPTPEPYDTRMDANEPIFRRRLSPIFETTAGDALRFYHAAGSGQFNNADNIYLIAAVKGLRTDLDGLILRVKPPSFPVTSDQFDQAAVRYWSLNQGKSNTSTPYGMRDSEFRPARDGFVYIFIGGSDLAGPAARRGYNFMNWRADGGEAVLVYRNMLTVPQYRGSVARVPNLPPAQEAPLPPWDEATLAAYEASRHLGEYAPVGRKVSNKEFEKSSGGMPSPGFA